MRRTFCWKCNCCYEVSTAAITARRASRCLIQSKQKPQIGRAHHLISAILINRSNQSINSASQFAALFFSDTLFAAALSLAACLAAAYLLLARQLRHVLCHAALQPF